MDLRISCYFCLLSPCSGPYKRTLNLNVENLILFYIVPGLGVCGSVVVSNFDSTNNLPTCFGNRVSDV